MNQEETLYDVVANYTDVERGKFIRKTYAHVALALIVFLGLEVAIFSVPSLVESIAGTLMNSWMITLIGFMGVTWLAERMANSSTSLANQYIGLFLYAFAEAVIFVPLLLVAQYYTNSGDLLLQALIVTVALFGALTAVVFTTKTDFSYLRQSLMIGGFIALGMIFAGMFFGFNLGLAFSGFMVVLISGSILYQTSNMLYRYNTKQYVAAALGLFAAFMTLLWYIIQIFMSSRD